MKRRQGWFGGGFMTAIIIGLVIVAVIAVVFISLLIAGALQNAPTP